MPAYIPIEDAIAACAAAGNSLPPGLQPIQSDLKRETSLIGQAYLNYIYQNDIANAHFCQAMLLMHAQVPKATPNPYVALFAASNAAPTLAALADVQLCFDYAIARESAARCRKENAACGAPRGARRGPVEGSRTP